MKSNHNDQYKEKKQSMRSVGLILVIVGGSMLIFGFMNIFIVFTAPTDWDNFEQHSRQQMGTFMIAGALVFVGFVMVGYGSQLYMATHARGIARYAATETAPAAEILGESVFTGISKGLGSTGVVGSREVIKIKCRNCGYLETEDAEFCSKCGKRV